MSRTTKDDKRTVELLDEEILELTFKRVGIGAQLNARSGNSDLFKQWCDTQAEIQRLEIERNFLKTGTRNEVPPTPIVEDKFLTPKDALDIVINEVVEKSAQELMPQPLTGARAWLAEQKAKQCGS